MTYSHAEATLRAIVAHNVHFMTRDLASSGLDEVLAKSLAKHLVEDKHWIRDRSKV